MEDIEDMFKADNSALPNTRPNKGKVFRRANKKKNQEESQTQQEEENDTNDRVVNCEQDGCGED